MATIDGKPLAPVLEQARQVLERTAQLVPGASRIAAPLADPRSLGDALRDACRGLSTWAEEAVDSDGVAVLLNEIRSLQVQLQAYELRSRQERMNLLGSALQRLRVADSAEGLAAMVPAEVARLGFHRTLFSWVEQDRWVPCAAHADSGPELARAIMSAGAPPYRHTRGLLEAEMVSLQRPMLVHGALDNPRVHREIQAVMQSRSYVAAPLVRRARVVGFVHADQSVEADDVDFFDRDLLMLFTQGLALAFERVELIDDFATAQQRIGGYASAICDVLTDLGITSGMGTRFDPLPAAAGTAPAVRSPHAGLADALTRREQQVADLMAAGLTNGEIAERLYVTPQTAKSHVKHVLRKLGAANRAQAGALWRQGSPTGTTAR